MTKDESKEARAPQEVELKLAVPDAAALQAIRRAAGDGPAETVRQKNAFFDTPDLTLHRAAYVVRLREEAGTYTVTAKGPESRSMDGALTRRAEVEVTVGAGTARALLEGAADPLDVLEAASKEAQSVTAPIREVVSGADLHIVGRMDNERCRQRTTVEVAGREVHLLLELDTTTMPDGGVDHELEVELDASVDPETARRAIEQLLREAGVEGTPSSSKAKRFFERLRRSDG